MEPWYWTLLGCPTPVIDESATLSRTSDGLRSLEEVGYDTLERVEQHAMTDVKGVPLASHDMHVVYKFYWMCFCCLMPRLSKRIKLVLLRQHRVAERLHEALHGNHDISRICSCECPFGLSYWSRGSVRLSRSEYKGKG